MWGLTEKAECFKCLKLAQSYLHITLEILWLPVYLYSRARSCMTELIVLGFNDTSTLVGHFVSSPREREKRDSRGDERKE